MSVTQSENRLPIEFPAPVDPKNFLTYEQCKDEKYFKMRNKGRWTREFLYQGNSPACLVGTGTHKSVRCTALRITEYYSGVS